MQNPRARIKQAASSSEFETTLQAAQLRSRRSNASWYLANAGLVALHTGLLLMYAYYFKVYVFMKQFEKNKFRLHQHLCNYWQKGGPNDNLSSNRSLHCPRKLSDKILGHSSFCALSFHGEKT